MAAALALLMGGAIVSFFVFMDLVETLKDGAFIAMVALPLIAYALVVFSDRVSEFSAGGIAVKFTEFANAEVEASEMSADAEADVESISIIEKGSFAALQQRREKLSPKDKVAMTIVLGRDNYYTQGGVLKYLNILLAQDADMAVIFVDSSGRFVASTLGVKLRDAFNQEQMGEPQYEFFDAIKKDGGEGLDALAQVVALTTVSITPKTTNSQALNTMIAEDAALLVSVDDAGKPVGVLRKDAIVAKMLAELAAD